MKRAPRGQTQALAQETVFVPKIQVALFARQLGIMLDSGVSLVPAVEVLAESCESENFEMVLRALIRHLDGGLQLSAATNRFPRVFPPTLRSLIRVGEETGNLTGVLQSAASWMEADYRVYAQIKSALTYPAFVAGTAVFLTIALFTTVVPGLLDVLVQTNSKIPTLTKVIMAITRVATNPFSYLFPAGVLGLVLTNYRRFLANRAGVAKLWDVLLPLPVLGPALRSASMSRYAFASSALLQTGTVPTRVVELAAEASGSALLEMDSERVLQTLQDGGQISEALALRPEIYDMRLIQFVQAGEASARLPEMFERASAILTNDLDACLERLGSTIEPILLLFIGGLVGTILVAIFLPLYASISNL